MCRPEWLSRQKHVDFKLQVQQSSHELKCSRCGALCMWCQCRDESSGKMDISTRAKRKCMQKPRKFFKEGTIHDIPLKLALSLLDLFCTWLSPVSSLQARCDWHGALQLAHPQHWLGNMTGLHLAPGLPHETARITGGQALRCARLVPHWAYSP